MPFKKIKNLFHKVQDELVLDQEELKKEEEIIEEVGEHRFTPLWLRLLIKIGLYLVVLLSMMPIIGFYGGLLGLIIFGGLIYYLKTNKIAWKDPFNRYRRRWVWLAFYAVLFGLVAHSGCKVHSSILMTKFEAECRQEKNSLLPGNSR